MTGTGTAERRLNVLHVINGLGTGGAERSLAELLPELRERGVDSTVICLFDRSVGVRFSVRDAGFDVRNLRAATHFGRVLELMSVVREVRADVVHTTLFEADVVGRLASRPMRAPVLTSLVNTSYDPLRFADARVGRLKLEGARIVEGWTARHLTSRFHAISEAVKDASVTALKISPTLITVVPRGRNPERLPFTTPARRASARRRLRLNIDDDILVNIGRQEYQKGQIHLLRAAARLLPTHPRLTVLVAGRDGNCTAELRAESSRLGLRDHVRWLGFRDDVPDLLAAADLFVFPSLFEGLGGAVIEALAVGTPIVASALPALCEVVGSRDHAALVPPGSDKHLADAIARLLADGQLREAFSRTGRRRFENKFTLSASAEGIAALYRQMATGTWHRRHAPQPGATTANAS